MSERFVLPLSGNLYADGMPASGKLHADAASVSGLLSVGSVVFNDTILELKENDAAYIIIARRGTEVQMLQMPKSGLQETDPTVPDWAKQPQKPAYTAQEVGAQPKGDYLTEENDPTVPAWAKEPFKPSYNAEEVGADPSGSAENALKAAKQYTDEAIAGIPVPDVSGQIQVHNQDEAAHPYIREKLESIVIPRKVSALENDAGYLKQVPSEYVTETELAGKGFLTEHQDISGKLDASALPAAVNAALAQAKAGGEFDGRDGVSPVVSVSKSGEVTTVVFTDADGAKTAVIRDGEKGDPGKTPVKGTDYFTAADKADMVSAVVESLPVYAGEVV